MNYFRVQEPSDHAVFAGFQPEKRNYNFWKKFGELRF
jgi:hypothetical protein